MDSRARGWRKVVFFVHLILLFSFYIISSTHSGFSCLTIEIDERIGRKIFSNVDIGSYFCPCVDCGYFLGPNGEDGIASEKNIVLDDKFPLSDAIIISALYSSSKIHFLTCFRVHDGGSWMFCFVAFPQVRFFYLTADDTSFFER